MGWLGQVSGGGKRRSGHWGRWTEERVTGQSKGSPITLLQGPASQVSLEQNPKNAGWGLGKEALPLFWGEKLAWDTGKEGRGSSLVMLRAVLLPQRPARQSEEGQ